MAQEESREEIQELWSLFREVAKRQEELGEYIKETDRQLREMSEATDRQLREMSKATDRQIKEISKNVGDLTGKWGKFVEGLVRPGAVRIFRERGIDVNESHMRSEAYRNGEKMEIDILVVNDEYVIAISVKSTLSVDDVNEHIDDLSRFRAFFPKYSDRKLLGAVAGIVIESEADKYAYRKGLFVITQAGEDVTILNDEKFKPKLW